MFGARDFVAFARPLRNPSSETTVTGDTNRATRRAADRRARRIKTSDSTLVAVPAPGRRTFDTSHYADSSSLLERLEIPKHGLVADLLHLTHEIVKTMPPSNSTTRSSRRCDQAPSSEARGVEFRTREELQAPGRHCTHDTSLTRPLSYL